MSPDGSKRTVLTKGDAMELDPALSPNGKRVAFITFNKGDKSCDVWMMNSDGSDRKKLTEHKAGTIALGVSWSPDGKRLAYSTMEDIEKGPEGKTAIMVMDADGKNGKPVGSGLLPAWSPDGKKLLHAVMNPADKHEPRLAVMDADGGNVKQLTTTGVAMMGAWSPDGKKIAYIGAANARGGNKPHIHVSNADGTEVTQLTKDNGDQGELAPRWSADGKKLYFNRMNFGGPGGEKFSLFVMDANGTNEKQLTKGDSMELLGGSALFLLMRGESAPAKP
jgi:TolB protein